MDTETFEELHTLPRVRYWVYVAILLAIGTAHAVWVFDAPAALDEHKLITAVQADDEETVCRLATRLAAHFDGRRDGERWRQVRDNTCRP